ncbi:unnamed protein product [Phytophthora lilii]|uniref:Unnamed protein product n=1 Tax=Phytophthora lilii TaxID=2077276 RepID=A0A9W6WS96_9STRA|nr:unnamed protein product [Phytophthora lilii]
MRGRSFTLIFSQKVTVEAHKESKLHAWEVASPRIFCSSSTSNLAILTAVVLSILSFRGASARAQASPPSKKRTIDLSASDDDDDDDSADTKRLRPNFLNEAEQTLLLAQLNSSQSSSSQKTKGKGKKAKAGDATAAADTKEELSADSADVSESVATAGGKSGKKTPAKKSSKKTSSAKEAVTSFFSPDSKQATSRKPTPDSNKKRNRTPKSSPGKFIKELMSGPPKPKPTGAFKCVWEMLEALGDAPPERWGHTATKISEERVVVYGGTDDDERTLGDLHVFDIKTHRWTTPLNCETITRTWHDAVYLASKQLVLVFGGERNAAAEGELDILSDIMVLDTECFLCAVAVGDDKIVYFGGNDSSKSFSAVHVLQKVEKKSSDDVWTWLHPTVVGEPPQARTGHSATLLSDGKILIFGGWDPQRDDASAPTTVFNDAFLLDTQTWEWQPATYTDEGDAEIVSRGRVGHGAVLDSDGRVHLFGGQNSAEHRLKDICTISISQKQDLDPKLEALQVDTSNLETGSV